MRSIKAFGEIIGGLLRPLFAKHQATFVSPDPPEECVRRLSSATRRWTIQAPFEEAMVGRITHDAVVLWRHRPWIRSDFRPAFYGRFEPQDAGARLDGHFALRPLAKAFMALWLGAVACLLVFAVIKLLQAANPWGDRVFVGVAPFILLLGGVGMLHLASRWAATDIEYLSRRIQSALAGDGT